jgi:spermidine/putrescine transport system ATP-binding protein
MASLEIRNVTKSFGPKVVLRDISFTAQSGEFLALLGPSGCGKTTLLKIISGIEEQDSGSVLIAERDISREPIEKRNIGLVFQNYALFEHMNVFENIAYSLRMRKVAKDEIRDRVVEALETVRLAGYEQRPTIQLSGGEQQRVALARAIVYKPDILLLDEPLSALDRRIREQMQEEVLRIQRETGITTVFVTHDQGEALAMADRILLMNEGEIVEDNLPTEVYLRPRSQFAAEFVGNSNLLSGTYQDGYVIGDGFKIPLEQTFPVGTALTLMIKEENIILCPAGEGMGEGVVTEVFFQGTTMRVTLTNKEIELKIRLLAREGMSIEQGQALGWRVQFVAVFPND